MPQLEVGSKIFATNENILVIAPTGAGKTAIGELAVAKELMKYNKSKRKGPVAILLVPLKAITSERIRIWENRQHVKVAVVTAETTIGINDILACDIVISVPEKIDSITRSPDSKLRKIFESVRVLVVDEIHLLDMDGRGDALEALITRFLSNSGKMSGIRIIALSATVPNFEDVADWLHVPSSCVFRYGDEFRPVKLETNVLSYHKGESLGEDRQRQDEIVLEQIDIFLKNKRQAIVFVNSRKGCEKLAKKIVNYWDRMGIHGEFVSAETLYLSKNLVSKSLSKVIFAGVGFHHAGLSRKDRGKIELAFINGLCRVLISTTTLAWGVNLPADAVIVRDVEIYDSLKGKMLIGAIDLQQMLGRAGRPGYSRGIGYGLVIAPQEASSTVKKLIIGDSEINSRLPENLKEHLLAEIVRGAILSTDDAINWLKQTYYYLRLKRTEKDPFSLIKGLKEKNLEYLLSSGFITSKKGILKASSFGKLSTRYYLRLETAKRFSN
ncbi:MAG: DEAD/DEAH box helicase [Candidatus Hodarchaeota archaeon]